jgi:hypothetical protein
MHQLGNKEKESNIMFSMQEAREDTDPDELS